MTDRFYSETPITGNSCQIAGESAHHILNVMRMKVGDPIVLFDGSDQEFHGQIASVDKKRLQVQIERVLTVSRERKIEIQIATAFPKGDRQKFMIEKLVELGVHRVIPLHSDRSVVVPRSKTAGKTVRWIIEASKQCGRNRLMHVAEPVRFDQLVTRETTELGTRWFARPSQTENSLDPIELSDRTAFRVTVAIGPEGGWTDREFQLAQEHGWRPLNLAPTILRIETAAIAAAVLLAGN